MISVIPADRGQRAFSGGSMTAAELRKNIPIQAYMWIRDFIIATGYWPRMTPDGQLVDDDGGLCMRSNKPPSPAREYYRDDVFESVVDVMDDNDKCVKDEDGFILQKVVKRKRLLDGPAIRITVKDQLSQLDKAINKVLPDLKSMEINHQTSDPTKLDTKEVKMLKNSELKNRMAELNQIIEGEVPNVPRETYPQDHIIGFPTGESVLAQSAATRAFEWED